MIYIQLHGLKLLFLFNIFALSDMVFSIPFKRFLIVSIWLIDWNLTGTTAPGQSFMSFKKSWIYLSLATDK